MKNSGIPTGDFVAIDFETADYGRDSACAVAMVRVEDDLIVDRVYRLIRPPRKAFVFSYLHGIGWNDVAREPDFKQVWSEICRITENVSFLAAHNASFDKGVLNACCRASGLLPPPLEFVCTVKLARNVWNLYPTKLPIVCGHLGLALNHHDAASDAEACAGIVLAARNHSLSCSCSAE